MNIIPHTRARTDAARSADLPPFFLPYQRRWITDPAPFKLMEKARQIGLTWTAAYACVREAATAKRRADFWVSSRDETQARLFLEDCARFAGLLDRTARPHGPLLRRGNPVTAHTLHFAGGARIHSLSSNPDAQAGKRGTRVLDEFALHPDPRRLYAIAAPGLTWGGRLEIISTHRGSTNFFAALVEEARHGANPKNISLHRVTLEDALEQGFLRKLQPKLPEDDPRKHMDAGAYLAHVRRSCPDEETFQQEYNCRPADDQSAFLPYPLLTACEVDGLLDPDPPLDTLRGPLTLGVDLGRTHDRTVLWLLEEIDGTFFTRRLTVLENTPFAEQEAHLFPLLEHPRLRRCAIDQSGLGRQFAERAAARFGSKVEAVTFTPAVKEALAYPVRSAFERAALRIPADPRVRADLHSIRKSVSPTGHLRFAAERTKDGHADRFWALALALSARSTATLYPPFHYEPLPSAKPSRR